MYMRSQTWIENGPPPACGRMPVAIPIPRAAIASDSRGMAGFFTPAVPNESLSNIPLSDAWYGLAPGAPCYDATHDGGMIHGGSTLDSIFMSNVTPNLSAAETACLNGQLVKINPPTPPVGYNPSTGGCTDAAGNPILCQPGTQVNTVIPCADGSLNCQPADPLACAWYCNLPLASSISPTFGSDCAGCAPSNMSNFLLIGGAVVVSLLLVSLVKGAL